MIDESNEQINLPTCELMMNTESTFQMRLSHWGLLGLLMGVLQWSSVTAAELVGKPVEPTGAHSIMSGADQRTDEPQPPSELAAPVPPAAPAPHEQGKNREQERIEHDLERMVDQIGPSLDQAFKSVPGDTFQAALLIPILAVIFIFGGPIVLIIVLAILYYRAKERKQQHINANIERLLAAGRDIPLELLRGDDPLSVKDNSNLHKGMRNLGLGTGWLVFLTILCGIEVGAVGFIFMGLGISQLVVWKLSGPVVTQPQDNNSKEQDQ